MFTTPHSYSAKTTLMWYVYHLSKLGLKLAELCLTLFFKDNPAVISRMLFNMLVKKNPKTLHIWQKNAFLISEVYNVIILSLGLSVCVWFPWKNTRMSREAHFGNQRDSGQEVMLCKGLVRNCLFFRIAELKENIRKLGDGKVEKKNYLVNETGDKFGSRQKLIHQAFLTQHLPACWRTTF